MNLSDRRVIAFASHALVKGGLDGLEELAIALSAPAVTGDNEDGMLTMGEILQLRLNADWVLLSACNTGAADGTGADAVSGHRTLSRARALQKSMLELMNNQVLKDKDTGKIFASYAHPLFWAPFIIVGDGR